MFEGRLRNYEMELAEYNQMYGRGAYSRPPMSQQYGFNNGHSSGGFFGRGGQGGLSKGLMGFLGGSLVGGGIGHAIRPHRPSNTYSDPNQGSGSSFFDNNQGMVGGSTDYLDGGGNTSFFDNNQSMVSGPSDYVGGGRGDSSFFDNNQRVDTGPTDYVGGGGRGDSSFFDNSYGGMDNSRSDFFGGGGGGSSSFFDHVGSSDPAGDFGGGGGSFFDQGGSSSDM
ncbi:hypothetical protein BGZ73_009161 [Actinomortierella ambigua]|nr:hypothetical protein BGZ73_009161 [Actinomortierella ambigua]